MLDFTFNLEKINIWFKSIFKKRKIYNHYTEKEIIYELGKIAYYLSRRCRGCRNLRLVKYFQVMTERDTFAKKYNNGLLTTELAYQENISYQEQERLQHQWKTFHDDIWKISIGLKVKMCEKHTNSKWDRRITDLCLIWNGLKAKKNFE